jgi:hypothetical protein
MMEPRELVDRFGVLERERSQFDAQWREIAAYMRPERQMMLEAAGPGGGDKRMSRIFDSTAMGAAQNYVAGLYGMLTNPANEWLALETPDQDLNQWHRVRAWLETVKHILLASFGEAVSLFYSTIAEHYADYTIFGTGFYYTQEIPGKQRIQDVARSLTECFLAENEWGEVDQVYRRFRLRADHAKKMFKTGLSKAIEESAEKKPDTRYNFLHWTGPNPDYEPGRIGPKGMAFTSQYVEMDARATCEHSGYHEFPWSTPRYSVDSGELYGRGPGMHALPDVKTLNAMERTILEAAQRAANPPLLAADEGALVAIRTRPGAITYGGMNRGQRQVEPLYTGLKPELSLELSNQRREQIKDMFMFSLMQLVGRSGMTATEIIERQEEKLRLLGPSLGRLQTEGLTRIVARRFGILQRAGQLPPPPPEMNGARLDVVYRSPMAQAQKSQQAAGILRLAQALQLLMAIRPDVVDGFDADQALRDLQEGYSAPTSVVVGPDELQRRREQNQRLQQMAQALQAADLAGSAAQKFAQAGQGGLGGRPPSGMGPAANAA